jgi:hypothetical protein
MVVRWRFGLAVARAVCDLHHSLQQIPLDTHAAPVPEVQAILGTCIKVGRMVTLGLD